MSIRIMPARRVRKVKTKNGQEVLRRLEEYLKRECDDPIEILCGFWQDQQDAITYQELRQAVADGTISRETLSLWSQDYSILVAGGLRKLWENAASAGPSGQPLLDSLLFSYDSQSPGILNWIKERGAEFVTASTQEQKDAIAALLTKKMKESHTVDELARMLRPCIGLTQGDAKAAAKLYDSIVENLKKEHPRMKPESIRKKALDATQKYAERKHRARAFTIAQTESAFAYNRGADEGVRQAQAQNLLGTVKKRWSTSGDDGVCDVCASLEGTEIDMDKEFEFPGRMLFVGHKLLPPAHPRCACAVEYIEVEPPVFAEIPDPTNEDGLRASDMDGSEEKIEHDKPQYLGSLDDISDDVIKSTLAAYESEMVESSIEEAVVITKSGLVFHFFGNENGVYPDIDLGDELIGASVTHNHPAESANEYSFSEADINLFMEYGLKILRGIDEKYTYELVRGVNIVEDYATIEELLASEGELARHQKVIQSARELGIGYRRWRR